MNYQLRPGLINFRSLMGIHGDCKSLMMIRRTASDMKGEIIFLMTK